MDIIDYMIVTYSLKTQNIPMDEERMLCKFGVGWGDSRSIIGYCKNKKISDAPKLNKLDETENVGRKYKLCFIACDCEYVYNNKNNCGDVLH